MDHAQTKLAEYVGLDAAGSVAASIASISPWVVQGGAMGLATHRREQVFLPRPAGVAASENGEAAVETVSEGSGVVRLLEEEPTKAERYAHAAELLAILQRAGTRHEPGSSTVSP